MNTTSVPVLKYLTNAQSMGMSATYLLQVSDFIAQDLMIQYLRGTGETGKPVSGW